MRNTYNISKTIIFNNSIIRNIINCHTNRCIITDFNNIIISSIKTTTIHRRDNTNSCILFNNIISYICTVFMIIKSILNTNNNKVITFIFWNTRNICNIINIIPNSIINLSIDSNNNRCIIFYSNIIIIINIETITI